MADEVTPGELQRRLDDIRQDLRDRHAEINQRMDTMVPLAVYQAHIEAARREHDELAKDIADVCAKLDHEQQKRLEDQQRQAADRRLIMLAIFTAFLAPLALLIVQTYVFQRGGAP